MPHVKEKGDIDRCRQGSAFLLSRGRRTAQLTMGTSTSTYGVRYRVTDIDRASENESEKEKRVRKTPIIQVQFSL